MRVAHLPPVRRNKAINLSLAPDLWEWIRKKSDNDGLKIPVSRVVAHLLGQVIEREKQKANTRTAKAFLKLPSESNK